MTFLFNTSFQVHNDAEAEFKEWAKDIYVPAVKNCGLFTSPVVLQVLTTASEDQCGNTYCIQMFSSEPQKAMKWLDEEASKLRGIITKKHGVEKVLHFTSAMLVVEDQN